MLSLALAAYFMSGLLSLANSVRRTGEGDVALFRWPSLAALIVATVSNALWIVTRWNELGHPPFADLYGCIVLFAWCVGIVSLTLELGTRERFVGGAGSLVASALLLVGTRWMGAAHPLPPVLRSAWFAPHVVSYFIAYGALTVASIAAVVLLIRKTGSGAVASGAEVWCERAGRIGLPFLTLGLVLGAVWGQQAWGDWWAWDPKETWALISWLLVAAWLHLWRRPNRGALTHVLLIVAVCACWFTLFGVNYLPTAVQSQHTYTRP
jgi:ABC-type transport system involved in cytochrome c biogenesis permease subunit